MGHLRKFWSLTRHEKILLCEACVLLIFSSFAVKIVPFRHIKRVMHARWYVRTRESLDRVDDIRNEIKLVNFSLSRAANILPWKSWCLSRSIAAFMMFRRRGVPAVMFAGVKKEGSSLSAHAWVVHASREVVNEHPANAAFTALIRIEEPPIVDSVQSVS